VTGFFEHEVMEREVHYTYVDTNIKGPLNVVPAARDLGISKVVHTCTSGIYSTVQFVPIIEEHPLSRC